MSLEVLSCIFLASSITVVLPVCHAVSWSPHLPTMTQLTSLVCQSLDHSTEEELATQLPFLRHKS